MPLARLVDVSRSVRDTPSRKAKIALLAECLRELGPDEVVAGAAFLSGAPRQRQTGTGWAALRELPAPAGEPELTVSEVDAALEELATPRRARVEDGAPDGGRAPLRPRDRGRAGVPGRAASSATCARAHRPA